MTALLALFAGTIGFGIRRGDIEPRWSIDTINDEEFVQTCLHQDACFWFGMATSVPGLQHGANYLHFKTLLRAIGVSDRGLHWILHGCMAMAVVLTALGVARLAGRFAGVLAGILVVALLSTADLMMDVTYNHRTLPFLAALAMCLAVQAIRSGQWWKLILAGSIAGLAANIHVQCVPFAASVVLAALLMPRRRWIGFAAAVFATMTFMVGTSYETWFENVWNLGTAAPPISVRSSFPSVFGLSALFAAGMAAVLAAADRIGGASRRAAVVLILLVVPQVVLTESAVARGRIEWSSKYYLHLMPAAASLFAISAAGAFSWCASWRRRWTFLGWTWAERLRRWVHSRYAFALTAVPGAIVAFWPIGLNLDRFHELSLLSDREMQALDRLLRSDLGWNPAQIIRGLRGPSAFDAIRFLADLSPQQSGDVVRGRGIVLFAKVPMNQRLESLPDGFRILTASSSGALVAQVLESSVDWTRFRVCIGSRTRREDGLTCRETGVTTALADRETRTHVPGLPPIGRSQDVRLLIEFEVEVPSSQETWVFSMPRLLRGCSGRIVEASGALVSPDGRRAVFQPAEGERVGRIRMEWLLGSEECPDWSYHAEVPFFLEGWDESVRAWEALLEPLSVEAAEEGLHRKGEES